MSGVAIRVEGLSKRYRLGARTARYRTLRESMVSATRQSLRAAAALFGARRGDGRGVEEVWALRDVSFSIAHGDVLGLIGHNGAGKSTLLKILSRITDPTDGFADLYGRVGSLLEVGTGFHPELTGRENVYLSGAILGMRRHEIERSFDAIVEFAGVEPFLDTPVKHFSSGMYLRLAFAVAAHLEPEILLVDEILAVGDASFQQKCLGKMGEVARQGRTVVLVTHSLAAISSLCTQTAVLRGGRLEFVGDTQTAVDRYLAAIAVDHSAALRDRADRQGSGRARIDGIRFLDAEGAPLPVLRAGEPLVVALDYRADVPITTQHLTFVIKVSDVLGQILFTLSTHLTGQIVGRSGEGTVYCHVPALPLTPDAYNAAVLVYHGSELCDWVTDAVRIMVGESDFFGSGKLPKRRKHGSLLVAQDWSDELRVAAPDAAAAGR